MLKKVILKGFQINVLNDLKGEIRIQFYVKTKIIEEYFLLLQSKRMKHLLVKKKAKQEKLYQQPHL